MFGRSDRNGGVWAKKGKAYVEIIKKHRKYEGTIRLDPDAIGVAKQNRKINAKYIWQKLGPGIKADTFVADRPHPCVVVELDGASVGDLVKYNQQLSEAQPHLWPPLFKNLMRYACLGGNHLNITLRLFKHEVGVDWLIGGDEALQESFLDVVFFSMHRDFPPPSTFETPWELTMVQNG